MLTENQKYAIQVASPVAKNWMQNRYNKKAFERSKDFYWEQWNANNEYNTPSAQRKRLEEAGFNPALMYNQSGGTGNATMTSGPEMSPTQTAPLPGGLEYSQIQLIKSQIDETDARAGLLIKEQLTEQYEANLKKLQGNLTEEQRRELEIKNSRLEDLLDMQLEKDASIINKQTQDIAESKQRVTESKNRISIDNINIELKKKLTDAQIDKIKSEMDKINAEMVKLGIEGDYLNALKSKTRAQEVTEYLKQEQLRLENAGFGTNTSLMGSIGAMMRMIIDAMN